MTQESSYENGISYQLIKLEQKPRINEEDLKKLRRAGQQYLKIGQQHYEEHIQTSDDNLSRPEINLLRESARDLIEKLSPNSISLQLELPCQQKNHSQIVDNIDKVIGGIPDGFIDPNLLRELSDVLEGYR